MGSRAAAAWIAELNAVQALAASVPEADLENATASLRELRARLEAARAAAERRPLLHCLASCLEPFLRPAAPAPRPTAHHLLFMVHGIGHHVDFELNRLLLPDQPGHYSWEFRRCLQSVLDGRLAGVPAWVVAKSVEWRSAVHGQTDQLASALEACNPGGTPELRKFVHSHLLDALAYQARPQPRVSGARAVGDWRVVTLHSSRDALTALPPCPVDRHRAEHHQPRGGAAGRLVPRLSGGTATRPPRDHGRHK